MRLNNAATIDVTTVSDVVMLVPPSKHSRHDTDLFGSPWGSTDNTLIHGTVTVSLKKGRRVKEILVELVGFCHLGVKTVIAGTNATPTGFCRLPGKASSLMDSDILTASEEHM